MSDHGARLQMIRPEVAADLLGIDEPTLKWWMEVGHGPPAYQLSPKAIRYRLSEVEEYAEESNVGPRPGDPSEEIWSAEVERDGIKVRVFQRDDGIIYAEYPTPDGFVRRSLALKDRRKACVRADVILKRLLISRIAGPRLGWREKRQGHTGPVVYFLKNDATGLVKIGTTHALRNRWHALEAACGTPLRLLGWLRGGTNIESSLHRKFDEYRVLGEWFAPEGLLADFLADLPNPPGGRLK